MKVCVGYEVQKDIEIPDEVIAKVSSIERRDWLIWHKLLVKYGIDEDSLNLWDGWGLKYITDQESDGDDSIVWEE